MFVLLDGEMGVERGYLLFVIAGSSTSQGQACAVFTLPLLFLTIVIFMIQLLRRGLRADPGLRK
jgi:hypothetical protein